MHILITGGTGLIGRAIQAKFLAEGHQISILSRSTGDFQWDVKKQIMDSKSLLGVDTIIHLAGAGIADIRWTVARKKELVESRVESTQLLFNTLKNLPNQVNAIISASAIGFYGADSGEQMCLEGDQSGDDFLADCTQQWESSVDLFQALNLRIVKFRIGLVLSNQGGIFPVLCRPIQWFLGAVLGSGKQWQSWIHLDDLVQMFYDAALDSKIKGIFNAVAPEPIRHATMTQKIALALHRPLILPKISRFFLHLLLGEMACLVTGGNLVSSKKIQKEFGFSFKFTCMDDALKNLING